MENKMNEFENVEDFMFWNFQGNFQLKYRTEFEKGFSHLVIWAALRWSFF